MMNSNFRNGRASAACALVTLAGMCVAGISCQLHASTGDDATIQARVVERDKGKGHFCTVDLSLINPHDSPRWYLFPYSANQLFPYSGVLQAGTHELKVPFSASKYDEGRGSAIVITFGGDNSFIAIGLPPKGSMRFKGFVFWANDYIRFVDAWEVAEVKVNGKISLDDWFPFPIKSSQNVEIEGRLHSGKQTSLNWEHEQLFPKGKPFPKERVDKVIAIPVRRSIIVLSD